MPSRTRSSTDRSVSPTTTDVQQSPPDHTEGRGNAAAQDSMRSSQGAGDLQNLEAAQASLADHTSGAAVEVAGRLPGGLSLAKQDGHEVTTGGDGAGFTIGVSRQGIYARFYPPLHITPGSFWQRAATGGITVSRIFFGFQSGAASVSLDTGTMGDVLDWFFDLKEDLESTLGEGFKGALPARLQQGGFDPYTEPDLPGVLGSIVSGFQAAFPAGASGNNELAGLASQVTQPQLTARLSPKPMEMELDDKLKLVIDGRASVALTAHFGGNLEEALADPKISLLDLASDGVSVEHHIGGKLANVEVRRLSVNPDLSVRSLNYELGLESTVGALKALAMLFQLRTGQDLGVRDVNAPELKGIREMIDAKVKEKVPEMLRQQIQLHDDAIPGFKLSQMLQS